MLVVGVKGLSCKHAYIADGFKTCSKIHDIYHKVKNGCTNACTIDVDTDNRDREI